MRETVIESFACPNCGSSVELEQVLRSEQEEILEARLSCTECKGVYPIHQGVPDFIPNTEREGHVAASFGFEWQLHHEGGFEADTVFGRTLEEDVQYFFDAFGISPEDLRGKSVLDGGCGSGVLTLALAERHPETTFVGLDINPSIVEIFEKGRRLPNLHVVHGSVLDPPFVEESFDFVWSNGVIHHTGDTRRGFDALTKRTKRGGKAYLWVYEKKLSPMVALRMILTPLGLPNWNRKLLYRLCQVVSAMTWPAVKIMHLFSRIPFIKKNAHLKILTLDRGYRELVLTWFDVLSPKYRDTYSEDEFESWFRDAGFEDCTRHWWPVGIAGTRS